MSAQVSARRIFLRERQRELVLILLHEVGRLWNKVQVEIPTFRSSPTLQRGRESRRSAFTFKCRGSALWGLAHSGFLGPHGNGGSFLLWPWRVLLSGNLN